MDETTHEGGCLCGAVRFRFAGEPVRANLCHCTMCRRHTGAPVAAFATFPAAGLETLTGPVAEYRSSPGAVRRFCPACGSSLFWVADGGGEIDVHLGALDRPQAVVPGFETWTSARLPWLPPLPGVAGHPAGRA